MTSIDSTIEDRTNEGSLMFQWDLVVKSMGYTNVRRIPLCTGE
jgi:hypothetical protein